MRKPKLIIDEQIKKMVEKGIIFDIINKDDAGKSLSLNTYLYKLFYYRKNFYKDKDGKYNIDFAYLSDLASIDMKIRYTLLHMCLDIEHSLKAIINDYMSMDSKEDGYEIIQDFIRDTGTTKERIFDSKIHKYTSEIQQEFKKYYEDPPYWVCLEVMSYGVFVKFLEYYYSRNPVKKLKFANNNIRYAKNARNKSAHNSVLIVPLTEKQAVPQSLIRHIQAKNIRMNKYQPLPMIDITTVILLHEKYCSDGIKKHRKEELEKVKQRYNRNTNYYDKYYDIRSFFENMTKIIDNYNT